MGSHVPPTKHSDSAVLAQEIVDLKNRLRILENSGTAARFTASGGGFELAAGGGGSETLIPLVAGNVAVDNFGWFNGPAHKYEPKRPGLYIVFASFVGEVITLDAVVADIAVFKNGLSLPPGVGRMQVAESGMTGNVTQFSAVVEMNGTTDYLTVVGNCFYKGGAGTAGNKGIVVLQVFSLAGQ